MAYGQRTDLNNAAAKLAKKTARSPQYGVAAAQMRAQEAVPMGSAPADVKAASAQRPSASATTPMPAGPFNRGTERPTEPITAGVNFGEGPNAAQAGINMPIRTEDPVLDRLRTIYAQYPNEDLADLLDSYIRDGY